MCLPLQALVRQASTWAELSLGFLLIVLLLTPSRNLLLLFFYWCVGRSGSVTRAACTAVSGCLPWRCLVCGGCGCFKECMLHCIMSACGGNAACRHAHKPGPPFALQHNMVGCRCL